MVAVTRTPLIAGNWKMNLDHLQAVALVQKLHWTLKDAKHESDTVEVALFPPFTDLRTVQTLIDADKIPFALGAQDLSVHDSGAYTGEISGAFLAKLDAAYVIIGHSERREYHAETDDVVAAKVAAALRHGLSPVICVGETAADLEEHGASAVPVGQLRVALEGVASDAEIVVAYEPVWAIGSGQAATPHPRPVRRFGEVEQHRELPARARRRRRPRRRGEPRRGRVRRHHPLPEARRRVTLPGGRPARPPGSVRPAGYTWSLCDPTGRRERVRPQCRSSSSCSRCSSASRAFC
ncbi:MAG: triosephosphate isomerase [Microbacterium sp.]|nr:triosephosphate isomerase [Microbacterium sp.]